MATAWFVLRPWVASGLVPASRVLRRRRQPCSLALSLSHTARQARPNQDWLTRRPSRRDSAGTHSAARPDPKPDLAPRGGLSRRASAVARAPSRPAAIAPSFEAPQHRRGHDPASAFYSVTWIAHGRSMCTPTPPPAARPPTHEPQPARESRPEKSRREGREQRRASKASGQHEVGKRPGNGAWRGPRSPPRASFVAAPVRCCPPQAVRARRQPTRLIIRPTRAANGDRPRCRSLRGPPSAPAADFRFTRGATCVRLLSTLHKGSDPRAREEHVEGLLASSCSHRKRTFEG